MKCNCTSFPSEGKLNGIATHTTEDINNELCAEAVLHFHSDEKCSAILSGVTENQPSVDRIELQVMHIIIQIRSKGLLSVHAFSPSQTKY